MDRQLFLFTFALIVLLGSGVTVSAQQTPGEDLPISYAGLEERYQVFRDSILSNDLMDMTMVAIVHPEQPIAGFFNDFMSFGTRYTERFRWAGLLEPGVSVIKDLQFTWSLGLTVSGGEPLLAGYQIGNYPSTDPGALQYLALGIGMGMVGQGAAPDLLDFKRFDSNSTEVFYAAFFPRLLPGLARVLTKLDATGRFKVLNAATGFTVILAGMGYKDIETLARVYPSTVWSSMYMDSVDAPLVPYGHGSERIYEYVDTSYFTASLNYDFMVGIALIMRGLLNNQTFGARNLLGQPLECTWAEAGPGKAPYFDDIRFNLKYGEVIGDALNVAQLALSKSHDDASQYLANLLRSTSSGIVRSIIDSGTDNTASSYTQLMFLQNTALGLQFYQESYAGYDRLKLGAAPVLFDFFQPNAMVRFDNLTKSSGIDRALLDFHLTDETSGPLLVLSAGYQEYSELGFVEASGHFKTLMATPAADYLEAKAVLRTPTASSEDRLLLDAGIDTRFTLGTWPITLSADCSLILTAVGANVLGSVSLHF